MRIQSTIESASEISADAVVVGVWKDRPLQGAAALLDQAAAGKLARLIADEEISSQAYAVTPWLGPQGVNSPRVVLVGLGDSEAVDPARCFRSAAAAARHLAARQRKRVAFYLEPASLSAAVCGSMVGCVGQDLYRLERKSFPIENIIWRTDDAAALRTGEILGQGMNLARGLVNSPANELFPESFASQCVQIGEASGFSVEVWDQQRLEQEKCGALLAVARGSDRPPRLVIMRYPSGDPGSPLLALVGKGVTFDSGGLSLKPNDAMVDMKCDMAGAATVVAAMHSIAQLGIKANVIGLIGLVENMVSGRSYKLGDVLRARSGKTIEVLNTDAEGRLVLADVLNVATSCGAARIIDLATLTGACMVALGRNVAGVMTNHQPWCSQVMEAAESCGEAAWQLPMFDPYAEQIKSEVADIKNVGDGRWGGAITAAKFLQEFVGDTPWVHLDIAGPGFAEKPSAWIDAGGSGCFVQTLVQVARQLES